MASKKRGVNPMDDLAPRGNLPSPEDNVTEGGPTQRNTPRRKINKSVVDRLKATGFKAVNRTLGRVANLPIDAVLAVNRSGTEKDMDPQFTEAVKRARKKELELEEGAYFKKGGSVKKYAKGGSVRGGGCEMRGKTRGKFV
jgi:hypothetical protein